MKRALIFLAIAYLPLTLHSQQAVNDVEITLSLTEQGSAIIYEKWDIDTGNDITEWYLVRRNLGDIGLTSLHVTDETGTNYENIGEWDINRSLKQKAFKCGKVTKPDGAELCWGVGSHGHHVFHVSYGMTKVVKSLKDYDMLHLQVLSDGLSSPPGHVKVTIDSDQVVLDTLNTRFWGFGFYGKASFEDGKVVYESTQPFDENSSVIVLLRFEKGVFSPASSKDKTFDEVFEEAKVGSDYFNEEEEEEEQKEDNPISTALALIATGVVMYFIVGRPLIRVFGGGITKKDKKEVLGVLPKSVQWYRDIPLQGNLPAAEYILLRLAVHSRNLPLALIMRMIHKGYIEVSRDLEGTARLTLKPKAPAGLDYISSSLYDFMIAAAGENLILEEKEFSRWASSHDTKIYSWNESTEESGKNFLKDKGYLKSYTFTESGQEEARHLLGLKKFLEEFTLIDEREAIEANLWREYMVYAALMGVAERVAKQLRDVAPAMLSSALPCSLEDYTSILATATSLSYSISSAASSGSPSSSSDDSSSDSSYSRSSGRGGSTSYGGGGGYSGGGRGGGGR